MSPHLTVKSEFIDLMYFSGAKHLKIIESDVSKKIVFEISISHFRGREYIKGLVRELLYDGRTGRSAAESIFSNAVNRFYAPKSETEFIELSTEEIKNLIQARSEACPYGLCLIASDRRTLRHYEGLEEFGCDLFYPSSRNVANALIVSPAPDADLSGFRDFIFLDTPLDFNLSAIEGRQVFVNREIHGYTMFEKLHATRDRLLEIFSAIRGNLAYLNGTTAEEVALACDGLGFDKCDFIFALRVFEELGLISFAEGKLTVYRGVKVELTDSLIYRKVQVLQGN